MRPIPTRIGMLAAICAAAALVVLGALTFTGTPDQQTAREHRDSGGVSIVLEVIWYDTLDGYRVDSEQAGGGSEPTNEGSGTLPEPDALPPLISGSPQPWLTPVPPAPPLSSTPQQPKPRGETEPEAPNSLQPEAPSESKSSGTKPEDPTAVTPVPEAPDPIDATGEAPPEEPVGADGATSTPDAREPIEPEPVATPEPTPPVTPPVTPDDSADGPLAVPPTGEPGDQRSDQAQSEKPPKPDVLVGIVPPGDGAEPPAGSGHGR